MMHDTLSGQSLSLVERMSTLALFYVQVGSAEQAFHYARLTAHYALNGQEQSMQKSKAFNVYLNGRLIDTVWFTGYTAEEARVSLVEHDGYDSRIIVKG